MTALAPPLAVSRPLNPKTDPINGHKGVDLGNGSQLLSMRMAICQALYEEMKRDPTIYVMGEEVAQYNGAYKVTKGLLDVFAQQSMIKRLNECEDVALVAVLLASDAGAGITGSMISIDGGTSPY